METQEWDDRMMHPLTAADRVYLKSTTGVKVAELLERVAEEMYAEHTLDENNKLTRKAVFALLNETGELPASDMSLMIFLWKFTPYWRHNFRKVHHKVDAYLIAAAIARETDFSQL